MRIIKHALLSLLRKPTKAFMIFGILFVVFAMVFTGIIINNSVSASKKAIRQEMGAIVDYTANFIKAMNDELPFDQYDQMELSEEVADEIAKDPSVKKVYKTRTTYGSSSTLKSGMSNDNMMIMGEGENMVFLPILTSNQSIPYKFENNTFKLSSGRQPSLDEVNQNSPVALISDVFAAKNELEIGHTFKIESDMGGPAMTLEVIGIYSGTSDSTANNIYSPIGSDDTTFITSIQFLLKDSEEIDGFIERNKDKLPSEYNDLSSGNKQYKTLTRPLNFISTITNLFIIVVFVAGTIITIALVTIFVRDRKFEIGLLLSSGESRLKIISQFILELMIISFIAFIVSMTASQLSSGYVSEWIAENQFVSEEEETLDNGFMMMGEAPSSHKEITLEEVAANFDASISLDIVLQLMFTSLALVIIAASIPLIIIMSYKPREALQS